MLAGSLNPKKKMIIFQINWKSIIILYLISLFFFGSMAAVQSAPGYMDADYYFAGGMQVSKGEGNWEPFIWNYLDDPQSLPHPSFSYWMPLASWLAGLGMLITGSHSFMSAQIGMIFLAALIPPFTALLAWKLSGQPRDAFLSAGLALFSGFYFPYLTTTDTFGIYMLLGAIFLLLIGKIGRGFQTDQNDPEIRIPKMIRKFGPGSDVFMIAPGLGMIAGLMQLARADGLIWLVTGILVGVLIPFEWHEENARRIAVRKWFVWLLACLIGYLIVMGPWMLRNLKLLGVPLAPGGARALWITNYDELYIYPASQLTFQHWLHSGVPSILSAIWQAFAQNIQTILAVQGQIFLVPMVILGFWQLRKNLVVKTGLIAWTLTVLAMTWIFPYQGARGGLFHSGSAVQILFWVLASVGLRTLIKWGERLRGWDHNQALVVFQVGIVGLAVLLTTLIVFGRAIGSNFRDPQWNHGLESYQELGIALKSLGAASNDIVMVNNAPGFYIATGRSAVSVPYGSLGTTIEVAQKYHVCFLLLEPDHPDGTDNLYQQPRNIPGLVYLKTIDQTHVFHFDSCIRTSE